MEFIIEPNSQVPILPALFYKSNSSGRRLRVYFNSKDLNNVVNWAQDMQNDRVIEEFFVGPINLEDAYMQMTSSIEIKNI